MRNKFYAFFALAVMLLTSTSAFADWTDESNGVTWKPVKGSWSYWNNEGWDKSCDGDTGTKVGYSYYGSSFWIEYEASEPVDITGYTIITANDNMENPNRNPTAWRVEGSWNETDWDVLDEVSGEKNTMENVNFTPFSFTCTSTKLYKYFRFVVTEAAYGAYVQFSEFHVNGAAGHTFGDSKVVDPTCTEGGFITKTCTDCNKQYGEADSEHGALGHDWVVASTDAPTCTVNGRVHYGCSRCDATKDEDDAEHPATGIHNVEGYYCKDCGALNISTALPVTAGWNADVVAEAEPANEYLVLGIDDAKTGFFTDDLGYTGGLPKDGHIFTNAYYNYYMDFTKVCSLRFVDNNTDFDLTVTPTMAKGLAVLTCSAGGSTTGNIIVTYTDGTKEEKAISVNDWGTYTYSGTAYKKLGRFYNNGAQGASFNLYEYLVELDDNKTIEKVTFNKSTNSIFIVMAASICPSAVSTAINDVNTVNNNKIYNLQGVEVNNAQKGIFIVNGKKYVK